MTDKTRNTALPSELLAYVGGTSRADAAAPQMRVSQGESGSDIDVSASETSWTMRSYYCANRDDSAEKSIGQNAGAEATPYTGLFPYCISEDMRESASYPATHPFFPQCISQDETVASAECIPTTFPAACRSKDEGASASYPATHPFFPQCISQELAASEAAPRTSPDHWLCIGQDETVNSAESTSFTFRFSCNPQEASDTGMAMVA